MDASEIWFIAGTLPLIVFGGLHLLGALADTVRPTYFAPADSAVIAVTSQTGLRFRGRHAAPSMWNAWLGFNISHGLGIFAIGLTFLLVALQDYALIDGVDAIRPVSIGFAAILLGTALRFWFWGPVLIAGSSFAFFVVSAVLA
jgi:hypothetical protein